MNALLYVLAVQRDVTTHLPLPRIGLRRHSPDGAVLTTHGRIFVCSR
jgi:hypothetical protein